MIYWILFYLIVILFSYINSICVNKNIIFLILLFIFVYFTGFRDGLGEDYENYIEIIHNNNMSISFIEPGFTLTVLLINYLNLHYIWFFLFFAFLTNYLLLKSYLHSYKLLAIVAFISIPVFYYNSMNLVRQFAAASIIIYAVTHYKNIFKRVILVVLASAFHLSAIFFLPFLMLIRKRLDNLIYIIFLLVTFYFGFVLRINWDFLTDVMPSKFVMYLNGDEINLGSGMLTIFFNISFIHLIYVLRKCKITVLELESLNLFFIGICMYNLIPVIHNIFRFALYFILFFPLAINIPEKKIKNSMFYLCMYLIIFFILFIYFIINSYGNLKVLPNNINSIYILFK